jgi:BASS family bile acid:Na+ symporter
MTTWILIVARAGIVLTVLALGLRASFAEATYLLRQPTKLGRALLSMNVVTPVFVAVMISLFTLRPIVSVVLMALAVAPIPPFLPKKAMRTGGDAPYTIGLFVVASVFAVVFVPLAVALFGAKVSMSSIALIMITTVLAPLAVGLVVHRLAPAFALRWTKTVSIVGMVALVASVLPIAIVAMPIVKTLIGDGTLLAMSAFVVVGLLAGHFLGGPEPGERTVLALTTSSRHPGVAFAVASTSVADRKLVMATLLLYMLVCAFVSIPYSLWSKRSRAHHHHASHVTPIPTH